MFFPTRYGLLNHYLSLPVQLFESRLSGKLNLLHMRLNLRLDWMQLDRLLTGCDPYASRAYQVVIFALNKVLSNCTATSFVNLLRINIKDTISTTPATHQVYEPIDLTKFCHNPSYKFFIADARPTTAVQGRKRASGIPSSITKSPSFSGFVLY